MTIWINNPFDFLPGEGARLQRYGLLCQALAQAGHQVVWWSSDWNHIKKEKREEKCANAGIRECGNGGGTPRQGEADPRRGEKCANAGMRECGNEGEGSSDQSTHELAHSRIRALKFIFFSSVKACADTVEGVLTEEQAPMPKTPYGQSKLEAEKEVLKCVSSKVLNFRPYILRPAMIHGPGNKGNLNLLVKVVQKGIPWPLGAFENKRSFTSIENVARVLEALIKGDVEPGTYQVADDEPLSTNQVIGLIAASLGRRPKLWRIPRSFMKGVARLGDILHLPLNSERLKKLTESYVVSNRKLLRALGWQKMPVSAEEGMRATFIVTTQWSQ
jgi:nucleoside-diphosphate-sugar epimerase